MEALFLLVVLGVLVLLPLLVLKVLLEVFLALIILPFKLLGGLVHGAFALVGGLFGLVGGLFKLVLGGAAGLVVLLLVMGSLVLLPLLPFLVLAGFVWLVVRAGRPVPRPV